MINTQKFLKSENSGSFFERANRKLISVNSMLRGSLTQRKARQRIKKKQEERRKREEEETRLEDTKSQKNPNNILKSLPRGPRDFISSFKDAIGKILFAFFSIKLLKALPLLKNILPMVFGAVDFVSGLGVGLIDGLATFIDFGYKAYESTEGFLKKVGGDGFAAGFEKFMGAVSTLIDILLLATVVRGMGDFGPGKPKKPKARRLKFLDFRKKGRGISPPAKPKSKPIKPTARGIGKRAPALVKKPVPVKKPVATPVKVSKPVVKPVKSRIPKKPVTQPVKTGAGVGKGTGGTTTITGDQPPKTPRTIKKQPVKGGTLFTATPDIVTKALNDAEAFEDLFQELVEKSMEPGLTVEQVQQLGQEMDDLIEMRRAQVPQTAEDINRIRKIAEEVAESDQKIIDINEARKGPSGRTGQQIIDDIVKPRQSIFSRLKNISPGSFARGVATLGGSVVIEATLVALAQAGFNELEKNHVKDKIKEFLTLSPEEQKAGVNNLIKSTEKELKYQKTGLSVLDKVLSAGTLSGDTQSDRNLRKNLALLYALTTIGVDFEDYDISNFLLQEKKFTDVTGLKPIQIDERETDKLSTSQKRRKFRRGTDTKRTDGPPPKGATLSGDLKAEIRSAESGNDYGATFRKYLGGFSRANEDITKMSISQVVQYQKDYLSHQRKLGIPITQRSAAVGAYQMLYPDVAAKALGVPLGRKFNKETQDLLANYYLNAAGRKDFETGKISAEEYNNRLAGQFASLRTTSGRGRYDDDGLNKAYKDILPLLKNKQNDRSQSLKTSASYDDQASNVIVVNKKQVLANMNNSGGGDGNVIVSTSSGSDRSRSRLYMLA